jgi:hypothetical protein
MKNARAAAPEFYETWKAIGHAVGRSERWCRYTAMRAHDPLPIFKVGGIVRMNHADYEEWVARQRDRRLTGPREAPKIRTVTCQHCQHTDVPLRVDGTMKTHRVPGRSWECVGSRHSPGVLA